MSVTESPQRKYCLKRSYRDSRDLKFITTRKGILNLPSKIDFRTMYSLPLIFDQGSLGSCTANAISFSYQFSELTQKNYDVITPSRLFIYYNERVLEGTVNSDDGATLRSGMKTITSTGVCKETTWPYNTSKFAVKPPASAYTEATKYKCLSYKSVSQTLTDLKTAISDNLSIVFGFLVYSSFESSIVAKTGMMPVPNTTKETLLGGHAVCIVGYDDSLKMSDGSHGAFIVRNSWGTRWGDRGYFYMPYSIAINSNMCFDFWVINSITNPAIINPTPTPTPTPIQLIAPLDVILISTKVIFDKYINTLKWTYTGNGQTNFVISRATNTAFTKNLVNYRVGAKARSFMQFANNSKYTFYYRIKAINSSTSSIWSSVVSSTSKSKPKQKLRMKINLKNKDKNHRKKIILSILGAKL